MTGESLPYNSIHLQRDRILARLRRGPVTRVDLERLENVPDATARVSELRKRGFDIRTDLVMMTNADGTANKVARYTLNDTNESQGDLFAGTPCAAN